MSADARGPLELRKEGGGGMMANRQVFTESCAPNPRVSVERYGSVERIPAQLMRGKVKQWSETSETAGSGNEEWLECYIDLES